MDEANLAKIRLIAYTSIAGMLGLLVVLGYVSKEQSDLLLAATGGVLDVVTAILLIVAVKYVTPDSWSKLRVLLYLAASSILTVFGVYGIINPDHIITWLSTLDAILNVVGIVLLGVASAKVPLYEPAHATS